MLWVDFFSVDKGSHRAPPTAGPRAGSSPHLEEAGVAREGHLQKCIHSVSPQDACWIS